MADHRRDLNREGNWEGKLLGRHALLCWSIVNDGGGLTGACKGHRKERMDSQFPSESWKFLLFSSEMSSGF